MQEQTAKPISWLQILLLIVAGGVAYLFPPVITLVWLSVFGTTIYAYISRRTHWVWYGIAASPALEVWARMSKAPAVPYEVGKYYLMLACTVLLLYQVRHGGAKALSRAGLVLVLFLLPSLIVALEHFDREQWVFNVLGLAELGVLLWLASKERWSINRYCETLRIALLPIINMAVYVTLRSPGFADMSFMLGANVDAAGGFGSNQVSTLLGAGIVISALLLMLRYPVFPYRWVGVLFIGYLGFRGLLTFSRGGMLTALIAICAAVLPFMFSSIRTFLRYSLYILWLCVVGWGMFGIVNNLTGDKLLQRYKGETQGTLSGNRKKTLNVATSGRSDLALADVEIFKRNIFFGVGPGAAKSMRRIYGAVEDSAAHTEITRLLSEHGLGGLFAGLVFLLFPFYWVFKQKLRVWQGVIIGLFTLSILTSMHSAMRTNVTTVFYVLAAMPVIMSKYWLQRLKRL